jgi:hypothetical protein
MDSQVQASTPEPTQPANPVIAVRTWFEVNRKKLLYGGAAAVVLFGVFLVVLQQQAGKESAGRLPIQRHQSRRERASTERRAPVF